MKSLLAVLLCFLPFVAEASAVKVCRVTAVLTRIIKGGAEPTIEVESKSAVFRTGHSMGEDCSLVARGKHEVRLGKAIAAKVGDTLTLDYQVASGMTKAGPRMWHHWELVDGTKPSADQALCTEELSRCDGKQVRITGRLSSPREIQNHAMLHDPGRQQVGYLQALGRQMVMYSAKPIECRGELVIEGKLRHVKDSGPRRYSAFHIFVSTWTCR